MSSSSASDSDVEMSSELSNCKSTIGQLRDELESVLKSELYIDGGYYAAEQHEFYFGNDPKLNIENIGLIELPLSVATAQKIIEAAAKAPYGHGEQTIVNTQVRDTWQIQPSQVQFGEYWSSRLKNFGNKTCRRLGVSDSVVSFEFHKLLLYETGSHFLPHQDSEKAPGMFASMVIILPSAYEGGEVHLQHGSRKDVIDISVGATKQLAVLGWYTDVMHEVKPITSGYRLALSYNIIHTSMTSPVPHLPPDDISMARLKSVLEKWNATGIDERHENVMVYVLDHEYSQSNLQLGVKSLKGQDASTIACLKQVAENLGFTIMFGKLEYYLAGTGRDEPGLDSGSEEDEQKPNDFYNLWSRDLVINELFDTEGNVVKMKNTIDIRGGDNFIPKTYFVSAEPDSSEHEPYTGNDGNNLECWYHRTALLLFPERDGYVTLYNAVGVDYALSRMKKIVGPPSAKDKRLFGFALEDLTRYYHDKEAQAATLQTMADQFLAWNDSPLFLSTITTGHHQLSVFGVDRFVKGMKKFGFEFMRPCFESVTSASQSLHGRLDFIGSLTADANQSDQESVATWCREQSGRVFSVLGPVSAKDIPALIAYAKREGARSVLNVIFSQLKKVNLPFDFISNFAATLLENRTAILDHPASKEQEFSEIARLCVFMASDAWYRDFSHLMSTTGYSRSYGNKEFISKPKAEHHIGRVISIIELSFSARYPDASSKILTQITAIKEEPSSGRIHTFLVPLAYKLSSLLHSKGSPITLEPFTSFLKSVIDSYFGTLPAFPNDKQMITIRGLGCGCSDCTLVDEFILDPALDHKQIPLPILRRHHVEVRLTEGQQLVCFSPTCEKGANPTGLDITKHSSTLLTHKWQRHSADAKAFLKGIGTDEELSVMLGTRYQELQAILSKIDKSVAGGEDVNMGSE